MSYMYEGEIAPRLLPGNVYLKQSGGKYGRFSCPKCGKPDQDYKFTTNIGGCEACGAMFQAHDRIPDSDGDPSTVNYWARFEELQ